MTLEGSRILLLLVQQWMHVFVSLRRLLVYFSTCGARRRRWQWYVLAGLAGHDTPRAVFPSIGWMVAALVVDVGSGTCWLVLLVTIRHMLCSLLLSVGWPRSLSTCAVVICWLVPPRTIRHMLCSLRSSLVVDNSGMTCIAGSVAPRAVLAFTLCSLDCRQAQGFGCGGDSQVQFLDNVLVWLGAVVQTVLSVWRFRSCSSSSRMLSSPLWRCGFPSDWCRWSRQCSWMGLWFGQLIISMMSFGFFLRAVSTGTGPGAVSTGTRLP